MSLLVVSPQTLGSGLQQSLSDGLETFLEEISEMARQVQLEAFLPGWVHRAEAGASEGYEGGRMVVCEIVLNVKMWQISAVAEQGVLDIGFVDDAVDNALQQVDGYDVADVVAALSLVAGERVIVVNCVAMVAVAVVALLVDVAVIAVAAAVAMAVVAVAVVAVAVVAVEVVAVVVAAVTMVASLVGIVFAVEDCFACAV